MLAQLAHRNKSLPEHALIADLLATIDKLDGRRVEAETAVSDLTREQSKADGEVEQVKSRRARDEERMNSGQIANPKDLENMQREIVALNRRIGTLEDEELEVMEALEAAQSEFDTLRGKLDDAKTRLAEIEATRDKAVADLDGLAVDAAAERDVLAGKVPDDLLGLYDKLRTHLGGLGAAALRQHRCEGCRLELSGTDLREISAQADDEVLRCPECDRILVRTLESGL
ncbi:MAG TPA: C4-type zinc ribbon domain-containing protein [Aeromicrobium sp.]|nr:C4-type zinc ribbon domain-containing protein [Aeromicrobium sp.]